MKYKIPRLIISSMILIGSLGCSNTTEYRYSNGLRAYFWPDPKDEMHVECKHIYILINEIPDDSSVIIYFSDGKSIKLTKGVKIETDLANFPGIEGPHGIGSSGPIFYPGKRIGTRGDYYYYSYLEAYIYLDDNGYLFSVNIKANSDYIKGVIYDNTRINFPLTKIELINSLGMPERVLRYASQ